MQNRFSIPTPFSFNAIFLLQEEFME